MDSTDDNAVTNEPEVRRTRSGRAVRPPAPKPKETARKTRKKMVMVEVEVSEEEEDNNAITSINSDLNNVEETEVLIEESVTDMSNQPESETNLDETEEMDNTTANIENSDEFNASLLCDSSTDQNDSRSVQFGSTNDSEQPFLEQTNSNQNSCDNVPENQDSLQTGTEENSINELEAEESKETNHFDVSVLNNDSQTQQCKPGDGEKDDEGEKNFGVGGLCKKAGHFAVRSVSYLFGSSANTGNEDVPTIEEVPITEEVATASPTSDEEYEEKSPKEDEPEQPGDIVEAMETEDQSMEVVVESATDESTVVDSADDKLKADEEKMDEDIAQEKTLNENFNKEIKTEEKKKKEGMDQDTEVISEDELPTVQAAKVPETEEVSDEELPGPKLAELPADTEVVSEDELPSVKKEGTKRKLEENEYDPGSPTSESEQSAAKKPALEAAADGKKEDKQSSKLRKLPELDKYWKAVNDDPTDFTGWTYLLQYVDQENDMEAAREAYDAFLSHYPYCYGYWRKYADYEKRKGNKKKCEEVFERGLKAIPLSVDLWLHYLNYTRSTHAEDEDHIRAQYERALGSCGLEFRSDRLWDGYIKWETEGKRFQNVTSLYDRLLSTPTQGYTNHFDNFQEHVAAHPPNKILEVDEFLALRKEIKHQMKHDVPSETSTNSDAPPGEGDGQDSLKSDEETTALRERIVSIRRKIHKATVNAVTARWNFEEGIKRPYFHVKPLERCQLKNWKEYLDFEIEQGDRDRIIVLFERCLIACALYEEFWLRFVHYLESLNDPELKIKIGHVYERACTIHHLNKPSLHLQWAMFEECCENYPRAAEILVNLEKSVPNLLQVAYRRINLERRRGDFEKCAQLYEHYINNSKNKMISTNLAIKYARFSLKICKNVEKSFEVLNKAIEKDNTNPRLYLQLIDLTLQKEGVSEKEVLDYIDQFLSKETAEVDQKVLFAQRKLEFLEDFGSDIQSVQKAYDEYQKYCKQNKEKKKKDDSKAVEASGKKPKDPPLPSTQSSSYGNYSGYGTSATAGTGSTTGSSYPQYSNTTAQGQYGNQYGQQYSQNDQYQYQNWQYSQSGYGGYNQWGSYGNYY